MNYMKKAIFNYCLVVLKTPLPYKVKYFSYSITNIALKPETTSDLIYIACCLHNCLRGAFLETGGGGGIL